MATPDSPRRVTIADVARHAGVSTAAASKVLRNAYGVSPEMAARVRASISALGYRPHAGARGMRGRSFTIRLLLDNIRNPFYGDVLDGVTGALGDTDFQVLIGSAGFGAPSQSHAADALIDRAMDGIILVAPSMPRARVRTIARAVPTVVVGHHDTAAEYDSVVDDDLLGAGLVVDHLVELGHRRIAHTSASSSGGHWRRRPEQERSTGYKNAMHRHGLDAEVRIAGDSYSEEGGYLAALELLRGPRRPTAVFAGADIAALGVLRAADQLNLRIPEDLSLAGYDNTTIAALAPIDLTSVDQAGHEIGATAARLLIERINGRTKAVLSSARPTLIARGSTVSPLRSTRSRAVRTARPAARRVSS
jgi:LacI family transcriptional regulator